MPCELRHFEALLNSPGRLEHLLDVRCAEGWVQFPESMQFAYDYLLANPAALGWWTYLFIHKHDKLLLGCGGFSGPPNADGVVEIGYAIAPSCRGQGWATEAAQGLVRYAFAQQGILAVDARTLNEFNASTKVLDRIGMLKTGVGHDPEAGEIWHWRLQKPTG
jgi:ribosomal-protein-alanine N-acetyltransferase